MFYNAKPLLFARAKELRNNVTVAEMILWGYLRKRFTNDEVLNSLKLLLKKIKPCCMNNLKTKGAITPPSGGRGL